MIPGTNPFKRTSFSSPQQQQQQQPQESMSELSDSPGARTSVRLAPPAPTRRSSAKRGPSNLRETTLGESSAVVDDSRSTATGMDDTDRAELDELERQESASRLPSDNVPPQGKKPSHRKTPSMSIRVPKLDDEPLPTRIDAPQINNASTPRPFGDNLPTPEIVSRDLTKPVEDGGGRRTSIGGGVTSAGLVDPTQAFPPSAASMLPSSSTDPSTDITNGHDSETPPPKQRRPSTTGPILCVLGCGTMGRSILSGVLDALAESPDLPSISTSASSNAPDSTNLLPPSRFIACVRREIAAQKLQDEWGPLVTVVRGADANARAVADSDYVLLGSKPQVAREILSSAAMQRALVGKVIISILAGTTIDTLQSMCPESKIIRVMPNTPSRIRKGMSVIVSGPGVSDGEVEMVSWIFQQVGKTMTLDEKHIDAATAMCGSGPAFMAVILEAMTDGGVMMGIPRVQAEDLAAQTMLGTACMVQSGMHPALIRNAVATPGGCTIGGLLEMEDGKIRSTMARTIQTATNIAAGLGK